MKHLTVLPLGIPISLLVDAYESPLIAFPLIEPPPFFNST